MHILLVNPPYASLTSTHGVGHQIPFGLLCIGGPLIDAGHAVQLLDAERLRLTGTALQSAIAAAAPELVMTGHAGSTPAHPACLAVLGAARIAAPAAITVYGGVFRTYSRDARLVPPRFRRSAALRGGVACRYDPVAPRCGRRHPPHPEPAGGAQRTQPAVDDRVGRRFG